MSSVDIFAQHYLPLRQGFDTWRVGSWRALLIPSGAGCLRPCTSASAQIAGGDRSDRMGEAFDDYFRCAGTEGTVRWLPVGPDQAGLRVCWLAAAAGPPSAGEGGKCRRTAPVAAGIAVAASTQLACGVWQEQARFLECARAAPVPSSGPAGHRPPDKQAMVPTGEGAVECASPCSTRRASRTPQQTLRPVGTRRARLDHATASASGGRGRRSAHQPTHTRALRNMRSHGEASAQPSGCQLRLSERGVRSGCGIRIVTRPSSLVRPVIPSGEPFGFSG
jgi:hypothetical protein